MIHNHQKQLLRKKQIHRSNRTLNQVFVHLKKPESSNKSDYYYY
jgi:hypothetical protein